MKNLDKKAECINAEVFNCLGGGKICARYVDDGFVAITDEGDGIILSREELDEKVEKVLKKAEDMETERDGEMFKEKVIVAAEQIAFSQKIVDPELYHSVLVKKAGYN